MPYFPCTIAAASRELQVNPDTLGILITAFNIKTRPSPRNGRAKLLNQRSYTQLARRAKPFQSIGFGATHLIAVAGDQCDRPSGIPISQSAS